MNNAQLTHVDAKIVQAINKIRAENYACTAREVSRTLRLSNTTIKDRIDHLKSAGIVTWTPVWGSLRVVGEPTLLSKPAAPRPTNTLDAPPVTAAVDKPAPRPRIEDPRGAVVGVGDDLPRGKGLGADFVVPPDLIQKAKEMATQVPETKQSRQMERQRDAAATKQAAAAKPVPTKPKKERTPEEIQAAKDRMAKVRAARKS